MTALGAVWLTAACSPRDAKASADAAASTSGMSSMGGMTESAAPAPKLLHFTPAEAAEVEAIAMRILPSDGTPGAKEAGALYFIDNTLTGFAKEQAPLFASGLADLAKSVGAKHGASAKFSTLTPEQQDALLKSIEKTPFFGAMRFATIAGFLALPKYGGNRDYIGWKFIGQEHAFEQKAPFGWYDRPENQQALLGKVL
jgi:gluconate 2-dehydrogenase gamma chain